MGIDVDNIETEIRELFFREFDISLLERHAEIAIQKETEGTSISVTPFDKLHAKLWVFFSNGDPTIYLTVGENSTVEIWENRHTKKIEKDELLRILRAVINCGFEETIWEIDGRIVKSVAKLVIPDETEPITITSSSLYNPFARKQIEVRRYLPYY